MTVSTGHLAEVDPAERVARLLEKARESEIPSARACLDLARAHIDLGDTTEAFHWSARVVDAGLDYISWDAAARISNSIPESELPEPKRTARLAVLGSYTTNQLVDLTRLVAARRGIRLDIYEAGFAQYQQEVLDDHSGLWAFDPDYILLAVHEGELHLPEFSRDPSDAVDSELARWTSLWDSIHDRSNAKIVQSNFVARPEDPFGHLSARLSGTRRAMIGSLNIKLGEAAGEKVAVLDCAHLASVAGRSVWFDDRYWHRSKQAVGFNALPLLSSQLVGLLAAEMGMSRKCLVLDLDGTLWGGVLGEDGAENLSLGHGPDGEAFVAFQEYIAALKSRGIVIAVCSKNDEDLARSAFEGHPAMRLKPDDVSIFVANWRPKPENIEQIARDLDLGLDALVFVDDNPAERAAVRRQLPEVDVISLPEDPAGFVDALASYPFFAMSTFTAEDERRTDQYRARAQAAGLKAQAKSLEDFLEQLGMTATIGDFNDLQLGRVAQLIGKTNQFNLTRRRHTRAEIESMRDDPDYTHFHIGLRDLFGDHGVVGVAIGRRTGGVLEIDTLLMSCRVIGRTVEAVMLSELYDRALEMGCTHLKGIYRPSSKNSLVADLYDRHGFQESQAGSEETVWLYDLSAGRFENRFIEVEYA